ncbi:MAG: hypothetical protein ACREBG_03175 [Pyrinomonadaceae bacterium]
MKSVPLRGSAGFTLRFTRPALDDIAADPCDERPDATACRY